ncbi:hypothetical protein OJ253_3233 [Cryptosporidium canis]|uniref:protein-serine/threonine phosphatase n=1 Tax=Cryptosporidium canis TaxID=195482 RepID=A0A9D5DHU2_9CRYT|nr:hypothetical protein OJ253_3233 [Cryptosporidium canis]
MGEDERIVVKCSAESFKSPVKILWTKYVDDKINPGDIILEVLDVESSKVLTRVKSICHGKLVSCLTPRSCVVTRVQDMRDENLVELELEGCGVAVGDESERSILYIKQENPNSHNTRYFFGHYLCDHTTFLSNICVECGYMMHQGRHDLDASLYSGSRAETKSKARWRDHETGKHHNPERDEKTLINAGFLSNSNDIQFKISYVDQQERSFIFDLLYKKRKLSLVLDLDNTLIHASSTLPDGRRREEFLDLRQILDSEMTEETFNRYFASVVMLESRSIDGEILPKGMDTLPHYMAQPDQRTDLYFRLMESLVFCIPFPRSSGSTAEGHRPSSSWSVGYYKLRPGVINMLKTLSKDKYEIYMYTMGTEYHAYTSLRILDPELRFFNSKRIFYRNNGFKEASIKSLSTLFPYDHRTLVILDDIEQAWTDINSLLKVYPYNFFPTMSVHNESGNLSRYVSQIRVNNRWSQLVKKRKRARNDQERDGGAGPKNEEGALTDIMREFILAENDYQLPIFQRLLTAIHEAYFAEFDSSIQKMGETQDEESLLESIFKQAPSIPNIIRIMRRGVLKDCALQFTGFKNKFFYSFVESDLYKWCRYFGSSLLESSTSPESENPPATHCICEQLYTKKYHHAKENGIPCVNILWLEAIIYSWIRPCDIDTNNPILRDPVNSDYYSPFDVLKNPSQDGSELEKCYNYSHLFGNNTSELLREQLWEEAFNDISFSMDEGEDKDDDEDDNEDMDYRDEQENLT